jgi:GTP-binding protein EngB required for normal cell division
MVQVDDILDRISTLALELKLANLQPQIAACRNQFHAHNGMDVAVFGRFKAGKSSFLNHLTGRAVLPIGVVPLTAVITRLRYGPGERTEVRFLDGRVETVPVGDIGLFVGENENPENRKQVAAVEVELPELKPFAPLQFVDTPGLGSSFAHNTEVALNWLPNVGAAIVAVSSDAPLSERDLALLDELRRHTPKIVLLLTKADLLTEAQRMEVLAFVQQQLECKLNSTQQTRAEVGRVTPCAPFGLFVSTCGAHGVARPTLREKTEELPVFFYSIKPELAGMKLALLHELLQPLLQHRVEAGGQILRHKLASLVSQTLNYLQVALAAATQAESARQALREKLAEERLQFDSLREELRVMANQWSAQALEWSLDRLQPAKRELQGKVTVELQMQFARWRLRLPAFIEAYGHWLHDFLNCEISRVSHSQHAMFCEPLAKVRQHLARTLRAFQDRLAEHVKTALGLSLTPHEFNLEVSEPSAPPVAVGVAFDVPLDLLGYLIPMALARPLVERRLYRRARYEVEKNLSRLAADWRNRIRVAIGELRTQAEQCARDELATLEQMLSQTNSNEPQLREAIQELEAVRTQLKSP